MSATSTPSSAVKRDLDRLLKIAGVPSLPKARALFSPQAAAARGAPSSSGAAGTSGAAAAAADAPPKPSAAAAAAPAKRPKPPRDAPAKLREATAAFRVQAFCAAVLLSTLAAALLVGLSLLLQDTRELWLYRDAGHGGKHAAGKHAASKHGTLERLCASSSSSADRRCSELWQFTPPIEHADADHI